ncbi:major facilitator superfamily transporter [Cryptosporidium muris RN66]|uniref:Major facilitator superfamily protein n=1 Tax=Cryptosporidium muris (strain RN66) TaxID=441375 RepID=B6AG18_CRYMR|nr:major facilitator superfamily transporter [Cryptosporidium muris RN66]EEA07159.1 major facilitator superfamily protein [Cryptosporidium muris RN66]|eukprot:XP_002141508.1 major facilitator superfamily transporter [Cryptosporidium muris RN66]
MNKLKGVNNEEYLKSKGTEFIKNTPNENKLKQKVASSVFARRSKQDSDISLGTESSTDFYETSEISRLHRIAFRSIVIICISAALDGCDEQLLPASLRALEVDLYLSPKDLGNIILFQILCLALSCPIWGYLADRYSRKYILATGVLVWGFVTILLSFSQYYWEILTTRAINGAFLGSVGPLAQSVLADTLSSKYRGLGFGMIQLSSCIGRVFGAVLTTSISQKLIAGYQGWRLAFLLVGTLSVILGIVVVLFMDEIPHLHIHHFIRYNSEQTPLRENSQRVQLQEMQSYAISVIRPDTGGIDSDEADLSASESQTDSLLTTDRLSLIEETSLEDERNDGSIAEENMTPWEFVRQVITQSLCTKSVILMIIEGLCGTIPWSALTFMTMYLQYCDLSNLEAALVIAAMLLGSMIGGPLGGIIGDYLNEKLPDHGRPLIGQASMILRIPMLCLLFLAIPRESSSFVFFIIIAFFMGLCAIAGAAANRPILADVVRASHRATVFSIVVLFEGVSAAAFGAPVVGILAENVFGYKATSQRVSDMNPLTRLTNAHALANALVFLTILPWSISLLLYSLLHLTYGSDKRQLRQILVNLSGYQRTSVQNEQNTNLSAIGNIQQV